MSNTPPKQDPNKGTLTPDYARWAYINLSDEEFNQTYGKTHAQMVQDHPQIYSFEWLEERQKLEKQADETIPFTSTEPPADDSPVEDEEPESPPVDETGEKGVEGEEGEPPAEETASNEETFSENDLAKPPVEDETQPSDENDTDSDTEFEDDLANLHPKTFQKKYGFFQKEYREDPTIRNK